jgi:hypothetical protein
VLKSELMVELIEDEFLSKDDLKAMFIAAGGKSSGGKKKESDLVLPKERFAVFIEDLHSSLDSVFGEMEDEGEMMEINMEGAEYEDVEEEEVIETHEVSEEKTEVLLQQQHTVNTDVEAIEGVNDDDDDDEGDEELVEDVFRALAGDKKDRVSLRDMLSWDLCEDLIVQVSCAHVVGK